MGNKATYRNLAEGSQRRGIKRQHLLNCFAYKMEQQGQKLEAAKASKWHGEKRKKNI